MDYIVYRKHLGAVNMINRFARPEPAMEYADSLRAQYEANGYKPENTPNFTVEWNGIRSEIVYETKPFKAVS